LAVTTASTGAAGVAGGVEGVGDGTAGSARATDEGVDRGLAAELPPERLVQAARELTMTTATRDRVLLTGPFSALVARSQMAGGFGRR